MVSSVAELLPGLRSGIPQDTLTELLITALSATSDLTFTARVKVATVPGCNADIEQIIAPAPPTSGSRLIQPVGAVNETKVVSSGNLK